MRKLILTTFLSLALASVAGADTLTEKIDRTFDVRPGANVAVANVNGRITVRSWDQPRVRVIAIKKVESRNTTSAKEVLAKLKVNIQATGNNVAVHTEHPKNGNGGDFFDWIFGDSVDSSVTYEVFVPRATTNVAVDNTNGSINLDGVNGKMQLETTNGRIEVLRSTGALEATTTNGGIKAELVSAAKGQPLHLETTNGRISLTLPATFAADLDAATSNGSVTTDLPVSTTRAGKDSLRGSINGGGTALRLRTTNGSIEIKAAR
ncbi:MAG TPA: DUF4097 family beta strand repeat-containing protein [Thermoanaerobaculia bacterium]|jgi:hypothetical protein